MSTDDAVARSYLERALAAEERVEAAEADLDALVRGGVSAWERWAAEERKRRVAAEARVKVALGYAHHIPGCSYNGGQGECDCGLREVELAASDKETAE